MMILHKMIQIMIIIKYILYYIDILLEGMDYPNSNIYNMWWLNVYPNVEIVFRIYMYVGESNPIRKL